MPQLSLSIPTLVIISKISTPSGSGSPPARYHVVQPFSISTAPSPHFLTLLSPSLKSSPSPPPPSSSHPQHLLHPKASPPSPISSCTPFSHNFFTLIAPFPQNIPICSSPSWSPTSLNPNPHPTAPHPFTPQSPHPKSPNPSSPLQSRIYLIPPSSPSHPHTSLTPNPPPILPHLCISPHSPTPPSPQPLLWPYAPHPNLSPPSSPLQP